MAIIANLSAAPASAQSADDRLNALAAQLAALQAENEKLRAAKAHGGKITLKVSEKGALSVYGMGRWPVTLYASQWETLLGQADAIRAFLKDNSGKLARKPE